MNTLKKFLPLFLAAAVICMALLFVVYFNDYERAGEHWTPASPLTHETARFTTDMGAEGDYLITVEKVSSKYPLLFVEYQPPGIIMQSTIHSDDGTIRLDQRFADEGEYRITVQHTIHPNHNEVINFTVQTPLFKYANDAALSLLLLLAGWVSGRRLRQLFVAVLLCIVVTAAPSSGWAHGHGGKPLMVTGDEMVKLSWLHHPPDGFANSAPLEWSVQLRNGGELVESVPFHLEIVHSESHFPVLSLSGVTVDGTIPLRYSPPDGTDYQLLLEAVVAGRLYHLGVDATAKAIQPTVLRKWQSFALMLIPLLIGMVVGWRRG
ncbi:MAG: hypothetical protein Q9M13_05935 [Mariprofundales bacterium]|nr:hypothetical protein [Mariprofundales bacterium]